MPRTERNFEPLRTFLNGLPLMEQESFAERCGTTIGYLRKALSTKQLLGSDLVIAMDRESAGVVRCEDLRPDIDWAYLRASSPRRAGREVRSRAS